MYFINNKKIFLSSSPDILVKMAPLIIALFFSGQTKAQSQAHNLMDHSHPNVTVDLSVISGGSVSQYSNSVNGILPRLGNRILLRPGNQTPRSMLHVPAAKGTHAEQPKKKIKVKTAPKSMLHVPPANLKSTLQTEKKGKSKTKSYKKIAKQKKKVSIAAVEPTKKSPPPAAKITLPTKAIPIKPAASSMAPKKLQAKVNPVTSKTRTVPVSNLKKAAPPSTPTIKAAPKINKKTLPATPAAPIAKKNPTNQQASLSPTGVSAETFKKLRVPFAQDQTKLPVSAKKPLISMAKILKGTVNQRLQLMAYAGGPSLSSSLARRMSLSRALAIRSFLIENGVRSTRIDVRALGNKTTEEPLNRVDLKVTER